MMKKLIIIFTTYLIYINLAVANNVSSSVPQINLDTADVVECQRYENDMYELKNNPGHYYFRLAVCNYQLIHDENSFLKVSGFLNKSVSFKYPLSSFALGFLYETKFKIGSKVYGVKGEPEDLNIAINNYKEAAKIGSSSAENNLGEIYLDEANLSDKNRDDVNGKDVKHRDTVIPLPDINKSVRWLEVAAKNGNSAAQGTLGDLYRQGIGVPQDYVEAYVWNNLSFASQMKFNQQIQTGIGRKVIPVMSKERDDIYKNLTEYQKNEAQKITNEYKEKYFISPSDLDTACQNVQTFMASKDTIKLMKIMIDSYSELYASMSNHKIELCGASYRLEVDDSLSVNVDQRKTLKLIPDALKLPGEIYSSKTTLQELISNPMAVTLIASLKSATLAIPLIYQANPKLNNLKVNVYLIHNGFSDGSEKDLFFSFNINRKQYNNIDWGRFNIFESWSLFNNFHFGESKWIKLQMMGISSK